MNRPGQLSQPVRMSVGYHVSRAARRIGWALVYTAALCAGGLIAVVISHA